MIYPPSVLEPNARRQHQAQRMHRPSDQ